MKYIPTIVFILSIMTTTADADLSPLTAKRYQDTVMYCRGVANELTHTDYWGEFVPRSEKASLCLIDKFADLVATDGDEWLEKDALEQIKDCRKSSTDSEQYVPCLKKVLETKSEEIAQPCYELGARLQWDNEQCVNLVSFLLAKQFETIFSKFEMEMSRLIAQRERQIQANALSVTNAWMIEQAAAVCEENNNMITYGEYWGEPSDGADMRSICTAEQFAIQVSAQGDVWIDENAGALIDDCRNKAKKEPTIFFKCLKHNLEKVGRSIAAPCRELGEKGLWSHEMCQQLVSYIFMGKFEEAYEARKGKYQKFKEFVGQYSNDPWLKILINPVMAIMLILLFVLDVVFLIEKGNWMKITKGVFLIGPIILLACFTKNEISFLFSCVAMFFTVILIAWNHRPIKVKKKKEGPKEIVF